MLNLCFENKIEIEKKLYALISYNFFEITALVSDDIFLPKFEFTNLTVIGQLNSAVTNPCLPGAGTSMEFRLGSGGGDEELGGGRVQKCDSDGERRLSVA